MATNNQLNTGVTPLAAGQGGTGVANTGTWTNGGNTVFSGAFPFTGTLTASTAVTFPTSGTLVAAAGTISRVIVQRFLVGGSTTYTPTSGMLYCTVELVAGGGAGGGATTSAASQASVGAGGGAGSYCRSLYTAADIGASQTLSIGAGGTGVSGGTGNGGGTTTFGSLLSADGGGGGATANLTAIGVTNPGGNNAAGTGGNVANARGMSGQPGIFILTGTVAISGGGGVSAFGGGGGKQNTTGISSVAGFDANGHGDGGGGAINSGATGTARAGGNGGNGMIVITEYCS